MHLCALVIELINLWMHKSLCVNTSTPACVCMWVNLPSFVSVSISAYEFIYHPFVWVRVHIFLCASICLLAQTDTPSCENIYNLPVSISTTFLWVRLYPFSLCTSSASCECINPTTTTPAPSFLWVHATLHAREATAWEAVQVLGHAVLRVTPGMCMTEPPGRTWGHQIAANRF